MAVPGRPGATRPKRCALSSPAFPPARGIPLRHVIEARHPSFADPAWTEQLSAAEIAHAIVESEKHVLQADITAPFIYARLERNSHADPEGYTAQRSINGRSTSGAGPTGRAVTDLPTARAARTGNAQRECFIYFISGDKVRAPAAAAAMLARLSAGPADPRSRATRRHPVLARQVCAGRARRPEETPVALSYNRLTPRGHDGDAVGPRGFRRRIQPQRRHHSPAGQIEELEVISAEAGVELRMWIAPDALERLEERRRSLAGPTGCGLCGLESLAEAVRPRPRWRGPAG